MSFLIMIFGILILALGFLSLFSHPLNWIGSATLDYGHSILIGFILICVGIVLIITEYMRKQVVIKNHNKK